MYAYNMPRLYKHANISIHSPPMSVVCLKVIIYSGNYSLVPPTTTQLPTVQFRTLHLQKKKKQKKIKNNKLKPSKNSPSFSDSLNIHFILTLSKQPSPASFSPGGFSLVLGSHSRLTRVISKLTACWSICSMCCVFYKYKTYRLLTQGLAWLI